LSVVVSHPFARKKANGWGTGLWQVILLVHLWMQLAAASQAAQDDSRFDEWVGTHPYQGGSLQAEALIATGDQNVNPD
jgi:hypothetical protein